VTENTSDAPFGHGATDGANTDLARIPEPMTPAVKGDTSDIEDFLPAYQVERLTPAQREGLKKSIDTNGFLAMAPMICKDYACPIIDKCPLKRLAITRPVGEDCPVESAEVRGWQQKLFEVLPAEEQLDPYNVMLVNDIVLLTLVEQRAIVKMAHDGGDIEKEITVGHTPDGRPLKGVDEHISVKVYERMNKMKVKLMAKLLATPQDKVKAATSGMYDRSREAATLMERMTEIMEKKAKEMETPPVVEAVFEVKEP